jgi:hypothetical protein
MAGSNSAAMTDLNQQIVSAWLEASKDLGITVGAGGDTLLLCEAFIPDFGSPTGAIVISARSRRTARPVLRAARRWHSELGDGYEQYIRRLFTDTLNDWGWFVHADLKPDWYTGQPWA